MILGENSMLAKGVVSAAIVGKIGGWLAGTGQ